MHPMDLMLPAYLKEMAYSSPTETPAHRTYGTGFFDYVKAHPEKQAIVGAAMRVNDLASPDTIPAYPFAEALTDLTLSDIAIVDVGGGQGQWLQSLSSELSHMKGRMILQDLPGTISDLRSRGKEMPFEAMAHDFFTPQSISGARFYYLRYVLHDWSDVDALRILKNLAPAFRKANGGSDRSVSRLLIDERVLPDTKCGLAEAIADLRMLKLGGMSFQSGRTVQFVLC